jgi:hypothetical protein
MVRIENLVVQGKCFVPSIVKPETVASIKDKIISFMTRKSFDCIGPAMATSEDTFLAMNFSPQFHPEDAPLSLKVKRRLHIAGEESVSLARHLRNLYRIRDDYPFLVGVCLVIGEIDHEKGFVMNIRSQPAIALKMIQLHSRKVLDEFEYSCVIDTNRQFIKEMMLGLGGRIIDEPKAVAEYIKTPVIEKLEKLGFDRVADLLKNGALKMERGDIEDGLTDLRESIEKFCQSLVGKIGAESKKKLRDNLNILRQNANIEEKMIELLQNVLYGWLYTYLSDVPVHQRKKINLIDARFLFSIVEGNIDYLLDRLILYRI